MAVATSTALLIGAGVAAGGIAGSAMAGSKASNVSVPQEAQRNYGQEMRETLQAQIDLAPQLFAVEQRYRPQYADLDLQTLNRYLLGYDTTTTSQRAGVDPAQLIEQYGLGGQYEQARAAAARPTVTYSGGGGGNDRLTPAQRYYEGGGFQSGQYTGSTGGRNLSQQEWLNEYIKKNPNSEVAKAMTVTETQHNPGFLETYRDEINPLVAQITADAERAQREADLRDVEELGGRAVDAVLDANPELRDRRTQLNEMAESAGETEIERRLREAAMRELDAGRNLTADQQRQIQADSRAGYSDRGMMRGNRSIVEEAFALENARLGRERERQQFAAGVNTMGRAGQASDRQFISSVAGLNAATTIDPFTAVTGRSGLNTNFGQGIAGQAAGVYQAGTPTLFNPLDPYAASLHGQNAQNYMDARTATAANKAAVYGGAAQGFGSLAGGLLGALGGG